jgi:tetratricopeptide (TPR) repeat protein
MHAADTLAVNKRGVSHALEGKGNSLLAQGRVEEKNRSTESGDTIPPEAAQYYTEALKTFEQQYEIDRDNKNKKGISISQGGIAEALYCLRRYEEAKEQYNKKLITDRAEPKDPFGEAHALGGLAKISLALKDYNQAIIDFDNQLDHCMKIGDRTGQSFAHGGLARAFHSQGDLDLALKHYNSELRILQSNNPRDTDKIEKAQNWIEKIKRELAPSHY